MAVLGYISEILGHPLMEPDETDEDIMSLIMEGYSSAYSLMSAIRLGEIEARNEGISEVRKAMSYKSIHKRLAKLYRSGHLKQVKLETVNIHGRKDYEISSVGLVYFFSDLAHHHLEKIILSYPNNSLFENFVYSIFEKDTLKSCLIEKEERPNRSNRWSFSLYNLLESYLEEICAKTRYWLNPLLLRKFGYDITKPLSEQEDSNPESYIPINVLEFQLSWAITSFIIRAAYMKEETMFWGVVQSDKELKMREKQRLVKLLAQDKKFMNALRQAEVDFREGFGQLIKEAKIL